MILFLSYHYDGRFPLKAEPVCGASLLTGRYGLTSAVCCLEGIDGRGYSWVAAGVTTVQEVLQPPGRTSSRKLLEYWKHPKANGAFYDEDERVYWHDFCVFHWEGPAYRFTKTAHGIILINSICVTLPMTIPLESEHTIVGFGDSPGDHPRWFTANYIGHWSRSKGWRVFCRGRWFRQFADQLNFCRWDLTRDGSLCYGDHGGPMTAFLNPANPRRAYQTGIISHQRLGGNNLLERCDRVTVFGMQRVDINWHLINDYLEGKKADSDD